MATLTLQPDSSTGIDTYLNSGAPNTNFGNMGVIVVGETNDGNDVFRSVIKFDLSSIPAGSTITSATLTVTLAEAGSFRANNNRALKVYRSLRAFSESQATWNVYTTGNNWGTAGANNTTTDREATDIGSTTFNTADADESEKSWTLTTAKIQEMIYGGSFTNNGFIIKADTETDDRYQMHSSNSVTSSKRPKLVIDYTPPASFLMMF